MPSTATPPPAPKTGPTSLDKRSSISLQELLDEYLTPGIPVVLTDATRDWPALGKFTPEFFKSRYGHLTKEIKGQTYTLAEITDLMLTSTPAHPAPYPCNLNVETYFPELLPDLRPEILFGKLDRIKHPLLPKLMLRGTEVYELFLGGNGASFPYLHFDALCMHTQVTQLYGAKEFMLYSPAQTPYLYPRPENPKVSQVDTSAPDFEKFPLFSQATPLTVLVEEGETILFTTGWWHTTKIHGPSISMGRAHLNGSNWAAFNRDNFELRRRKHPAVALATLAYGKILGRLLDMQEKFA